MVGAVAAVGALAAWRRGSVRAPSSCDSSLNLGNAGPDRGDTRPTHDDASDAEIEAAFREARATMWFGVGAVVVPVAGIIFGLGLTTWRMSEPRDGLSTRERVRTWADSMSGWLAPDIALQTSLVLVVIVGTVNVAVSLAPSPRASVRDAAAMAVWATAQTFLAVAAASCSLFLAAVVALRFIGTHSPAVGHALVLAALALLSVAFAATISVSKESGVASRQSESERRRRTAQLTSRRDDLLRGRSAASRSAIVMTGALVALLAASGAGAFVLVISILSVSSAVWTAVGIAAAWVTFVFLEVWYLTVVVWTAYARNGERRLVRVSIGLATTWHVIAVGLVVRAYLSADAASVVATVATAVMFAIPGLYAALIFVAYRQRTRRWNPAWRYLSWPAEVVWDSVARGLDRRISGLHESVSTDGAPIRSPDF